LDFLRGLAITLMVVNHVGTRMAPADLQAKGPLAELIFIGSFAPVVFFFTTGFGIGFAKRHVDVRSLLSVSWKAGLLLVADQFMFWSAAVPWGLDFLGFIAISSVLVTCIAMSRRPIAYCVAIMLTVIAVRFGLGAWVSVRFDLPGVVKWLVGARGIAPISYPFSPWIIYPLMGFMLGRRYISIRAMGASFPRPWLYVATLGALISAVALHHAHAIFFRWGTMSFAFFVLSLGVLFLTLIVAWKVPDHSRSARFLSLRGISSLAIVPIHYALIELIAALGWVVPDPWGTLAAMSFVLPTSIVLARAFANGANSWISAASPAVPWLVLTSVIALCAGVCWYPFREAGARFAAMVVGQLAIAALLVVRSRKVSLPLVTNGVLQ
jgi:hypothetical protein